MPTTVPLHTVDSVPTTDTVAAKIIEAPLVAALTEPTPVPVAMTVEVEIESAASNEKVVEDGVMCVSKEMGFSQRPVLEHLNLDMEKYLVDDIQLHEFTFASNPILHIPIFLDVVRVGVRPLLESDRRVSLVVCHPEVEVSHAETAKELKEFGSLLSTLF